jgi:hypothetical protein
MRAVAGREEANTRTFSSRQYLRIRSQIPGRCSRRPKRNACGLAIFTFGPGFSCLGAAACAPPAGVARTTHSVFQPTALGLREDVREPLKSLRSKPRQQADIDAPGDWSDIGGGVPAPGRPLHSPGRRRSPLAADDGAPLRIPPGFVILFPRQISGGWRRHRPLCNALQNGVSPVGTQWRRARLGRRKRA